MKSEKKIAVIGKGKGEYDIDKDILIQFMRAHPFFFKDGPYSDSPETEKEQQLDENCKKHGRYWHRMTDGAYHVCDCDGCLDEVYPSIDQALKEDSYWWFF